MTDNTGYELVRQKALDAGIVKSETRGKFQARCPAHQDDRASLSVGKGTDGRALVYCFAGCATPDVVKALGLTMKQLFGADEGKVDVAEYVYTDEDGAPLIKVIRTWPKGFTQLRWEDEMWKPGTSGARRTLYGLPEVLEADKVWVVEGEKDVETLRQLGVVATTWLGGASGWRADYAEVLRGKVVEIIADDDEPGREAAMRVRNDLRHVATSVDVWTCPDDAKDVTDLVNAGKGLGDLVRLVTSSGVEFEPTDWETWEAEEEQWLLKPYIPKSRRVMLFGPEGSLKSLWSLWVAARLAHEGHKVAYFNLEMSMPELSRRLRKLAPPQDNFKLYRKVRFDSAADLAAACDLFKGYSLIVIDAWTAVHGNQNDNDTIARIDREFFLPLIEETGATLLILDNIGQAIMTDRGKMQPDWARGASTKGNKMDLTLMMDRPDETDNHTARLKVKKLRGEGTIPAPAIIRTEKDKIDFRYVDSQGVDLGSMWEGAPEPPKQAPEDAPPSLLDRMKVAREKARLQEAQDEPPPD